MEIDSSNQETIPCFKSQMNYTLQVDSEDYVQEH